MSAAAGLAIQSDDLDHSGAPVSEPRWHYGLASKQACLRGELRRGDKLLTHGERLPDDAEGQHVITEVYRLQAAPELLAEIDPDVIDDVKIFAAIGADLPFILPEGEDVPLAPSGGGSVGAGSRSNNRPSSVGLGTGGLY